MLKLNEMKLFTEQNIKVLNEFVKSYPNDTELGSVIRNSFRMDNFVMSIPNDFSLGKIIREKLKDLSK